MSAEEMLNALKEPFLQREVHWRTGATNAKKLGVKPWQATKGIGLAYINARDCMKRLDDTLGCNNWQRKDSKESGVAICHVGIRIDGEWIWKSDAAGETDIEGEKGAASRAFVRACANHGVGRYLYYLENKWMDLTQDRSNPNYPFTNKPVLPNWALNKSEQVRKEKAA